MSNRDLVVAAAWPPERQPDRLVESLIDTGRHVTVAAEGGRARRFEAHGAEVIALARANDVTLGTLRNLARAGARAATSPRDLLGVSRRLRSLPDTAADARALSSAQGAARALSSAQGAARALSSAQGAARALAEGWYRLLPLVGRHWDRVLLPAEEAALAYLPLIGVAGRGVVVVERPPSPAPFASSPDRPAPTHASPAWSALMRAASEVHASSPALADMAVALGAAAATTRVVRPPLDPDYFRPRSDASPARDLQVACPAPFHWTGGHDYVLVAARQLLDDGAGLHLHLAGDGSDRQRLLYTVDDLGLRDAVTVHPGLDRSSRLALLNGSDVAVVAAVQDRPWPEILEAMSCGLPVVACDLASVREMATDEVEGSLVPPRNVAALVSALCRLATDAQVRVRMGQAARDRAVQWAMVHGPARVAARVAGGGA